MSPKTRNTRKSQRSQKSPKELRITNPTQYRAVDSLIKKGPLTIILVHSPSCGHCVRYMPMWNDLANIKEKQSNMVSMESSIFLQTPLSEKVSIDGVPSVLFVTPSGEIEVAKDHTNTSIMTETVRSGKTNTGLEPSTGSPTVSLSDSYPNPLKPTPGYVSQTGGSPWAAFMVASQKKTSRKTRKRR